MIEIALLIIAYTLITITIFLEVICYFKKLESLETINFTISLLLLIVALTISPFLDPSSSSESTNVFTLLTMVLVGLTTPLNILNERKHKISSFWKKAIILFSTLLFISVIIGYFQDFLKQLQYIVASFLGLSVVVSMLLIRTTKPHKKNAHKEKVEQLLALAFMIIVTLFLLQAYTNLPNPFNNIIRLSIPISFIFLAGTKIWDDLKRLSILNSKVAPIEQHLINFSLTNREKEIATALTKGLTYKQIAEQLNISMPTVKTHASNIYKKCGVKSRAELTALLIS